MIFQVTGMKNTKRLLFYILLNITVSAVTTLTVLIAWDQLGSSVPGGILPRAISFMQPANPPQATSPVAEAQPTNPSRASEFLTYQVRPGDTLESIATASGVTAEEIIALNGLEADGQLEEGVVLRIPSSAQGSVIIDSVVGVGDLETEHVVLKQRGEKELSLVGWRLEDESGHAFIFPQYPEMILFKGGAVSIYTKTGANTVIDLFWGLDRAIWYSGATVILRDALGNVRYVYLIP